jgi:hypothetical protein
MELSKPHLDYRSFAEVSSRALSLQRRANNSPDTLVPLYDSELLLLLLFLPSRYR